MNFEEMLDTREGIATNKEELPFGTFYRKRIDNKYRHVVALRPELTDSIVFCEALKADVAMSSVVKHPNQIKFTFNEDKANGYEIELELGNYLTFHQLLTQNPAVVASKDYINRVVEQMGGLLKQLHEHGVYQCCLAPQQVFVRKGDNMPLLLCHGSFYKGLKDQKALYAGFEEFVAPEVLNGETPDERSDVYALGKFIEQLHEDSSMAFEYKRTVATATASEPEKRYATIDQMLEAINSKRSMLHTAISIVAAFGIALLAIFLYLDMMPEPVDVEFVKPAVEEKMGDPYESGMTPAELGLDPNDSTYMTDEDKAEQVNLEAEVERIFRRQFAREAERVLSLIYSKDNMNSSEQAFINGNNTQMEELLRKRDDLANQSGLELEKANKIANEIIDKIRVEKRRQLKSLGYQNQVSEDE